MNTALLVIDVQMALLEDDNNGAKRSNPAAADNITRLLTAFREKGDAPLFTCITTVPTRKTRSFQKHRVPRYSHLRPRRVMSRW